MKKTLSKLGGVTVIAIVALVLAATASAGRVQKHFCDHGVSVLVIGQENINHYLDLVKDDPGNYQSDECHATASSSPVPQDSGRYLVWSPSKGCQDLDDTSARNSQTSESGARMGVYVDGYRLDATGGQVFIGATCDPPSKFGSVTDDGYKVAPNGLPDGVTDSIADLQDQTDALYEHYTLTSSSINPFG